MMSLAMLDQTSEEEIKEGYQNNNVNKIGKETWYIFYRVIHTMLSHYKDRLKGITFNNSEIDFNVEYLQSDKNKKNAQKMMNFIKNANPSISDLDFGKLKVDLERWYYGMGGEGICFEYRDEYLITPKEAEDLLGVSKVTLNKYMKQGLEVVNTNSHRKIPKHTVFLWQDPVYAIRMQMLAQEKMRRNQTPEERLNEVQDEILELQKLYKAKTYWELLEREGIDSLDDIDNLDDPSDIRKWIDLEEEEEELLEKTIMGDGD